MTQEHNSPPILQLDALMNKKITCIYAIVYAQTAIALGFLMGIHGPDLMLLFSMFTFAISISILFSCYYIINLLNIRNKIVIFTSIAIGNYILMIVVIVLSWRPLIDYEVNKRSSIIKKIKVYNVSDNPLMSSKGKPIGIQLKYSIEFPESDYFTVYASLRSEKYLGMSVFGDMREINRMLDNSPTFFDQKYKKGLVYNFTVDMIPYFIKTNVINSEENIIGGIPAEYQMNFKKIVQSGDRVHFTITISGTPFRGRTNKSYSLREFYENSLGERINRKIIK